MAEVPGGEPRREGGSGIGTRLRGARERSGVSLAQAAQRLHVSAEILGALEDERFECIGAPIYVKSYLARYAELLGESAEELQAQLAGATMAEPDLTRIPRAAPVDNRVSLLLAAAGIGAGVVLAAGLAWWGWKHLYRRTAEVLPPSQVRTKPLALVTSVPRQAAPGAAAQATPAASSAPAVAVGTRITLRFPAASWVSVTDAAGRDLYRGLVLAGTLQSFTGAAPLHVVLGYAEGVTLTVNGHAVPLTPYVGQDHAISIAVASDGRISPAPRHAGHAGG